MDFLNEKQFVSKGMNLAPTQVKPKIKEQGKERLDNPDTDAKGTAESIVEKSGVNVIKVEQTQTKDGIKVILRRIELAAEWIAVFLTLENNNNNHNTIKIYDKSSITTQGDYESKVTSKGPNYRTIKDVKYGTKQDGAVKFEGLPYNEPTIRFEFWVYDPRSDVFFGDPTRAKKTFGTYSWSFVFEVQIQK